jgi:hypothetical protein
MRGVDGVLPARLSRGDPPHHFAAGFSINRGLGHRDGGFLNSRGGKRA